MSVVSFIRRCLDSGMPMDMALAAAEHFEAEVPAIMSVDPTERRKANGRIRQARYEDRKRQKASEQRHEPSDLTQADAKEIPPTPPKENNHLSPPLKGGISPQPSEPAQPEKPLSGTSAEAADEPTPPRGGRRKPARTIPDGFPTAELIQAERDKAILAGIELDGLQQAERFRNHAQQTDRRCADWTAAWRNWCLKAHEWSPKLLIVARPAEPEDPWPRRLLNFRIAGYWDSDWGPKPGKPGYLGPPPEDLAA